MKRNIPLLIAAIGGFVLIIASFIPATQSWGETAAIWFDILAAIAFILGGGNLLMSHLKKVSDRTGGWGYSVITIASFFLMMAFGLLKIGVSPAPNQEHYGSSFAQLELKDFPKSIEFRVPGKLPEDAKRVSRKLPESVQSQFSIQGNELVFHGWMLSTQKSDLKNFSSQISWQASIDSLAEKAQPASGLAGRLEYLASHRALSFQGSMPDSEKEQLLALESSPQWTKAINTLAEQANEKVSHTFQNKPDSFQIPKSLKSRLALKDENTVELTGSLSQGQRDQLIKQFPVARPMTEIQQSEFKKELESKSQNPLSNAQLMAFSGILKSSWGVENLKNRLNDAGKGRPRPQSSSELLAQQKEGVETLEQFHPARKSVTLNDAQAKLLNNYRDNPEMRIAELSSALKEAGDWTGAQSGELKSFLSSQPTVGMRNKSLYIALTSVGNLESEQSQFLLADYRKERQWSSEVYTLFKKAHTTKYSWSGKFDEGPSAFGWMYEYVFKPLQATVFALLAFFVASAAFRAFRAKNIEAILLLSTAFIILLGRTYAGVFLTSFLPESLAFLRVENLTVWIMQTLNTAGNRAIMIGIALGIAATSLKILLGIDRSYLGSGDD